MQTTPSTERGVDRWLGMTYDDTDTMVLHRFLKRHHNDIGRILLSVSGALSKESAASNEPGETWAQLCDILVDLGPVIESDKPSVAASFEFQHFMAQNAHRNRDSVRGIFYACEVWFQGPGWYVKCVLIAVIRTVRRYLCFICNHSTWKFLISIFSYIISAMWAVVSSARCTS